MKVRKEKRFKQKYKNPSSESGRGVLKTVPVSRHRGAIITPDHHSEADTFALTAVYFQSPAEAFPAFPFFRTRAGAGFPGGLFSMHLLRNIILSIHTRHVRDSPLRCGSGGPVPERGSARVPGAYFRRMYRLPSRRKIPSLIISRRMVQ